MRRPTQPDQISMVEEEAEMFFRVGGWPGFNFHTYLLCRERVSVARKLANLIEFVNSCYVLLSVFIAQ